MILILIAFLAAMVGGVWLQRYSDKHDNFLVELLALGIVLLSGIGLVVYGYTVFEYIAAGTKADIVNREFGTNYTQKEIFFGEDIIDEIRQIKRNRYEINGDIRRGAK